MAFTSDVPSRAIIRPHGGRHVGRTQEPDTKSGTWFRRPYVLGARIEKESGHTLG